MNTSIPQQINFVGKLEENNGAAIFYCWTAAKHFPLDSLIVAE